ncbi:ATP-binding protein [Anaeromyxobacter sp. SG64]|uniref:hybrid sensor histidine kinase/response regulator n=1 Tax=Anaeromyxobacter sp. SG64 TaxID=2925409 RepID=UPI001F5952D4|nr:ATP-binding protein [Anaeromyxobacter sp. SG64]
MSKLLASLRVRLLFLVLVAVVPALGILTYAAREHRRLLETGVEQESHAIARLIAERNGRVIERARGVLMGISRLPSVRAADAEACSRDLAPLVAGAIDLGNLGVVALDGEYFCRGGGGRRVNLLDRDNVRVPLETGEFAVGAYRVSRSRGVPTVGLGLPVRSDEGRVTAVAIAMLDVATLQRDLDDMDLPEGGAAVVLDRDGTILALRPYDVRQVGTRLPPALHAGAMEDRARRAVGPDGVERIYGFHDVWAGPGPAVLHVAAGVPIAAAYAPVNRILRRTFLAFGGIALLALAAAGIAGERLLVRKLRALLAAARRIAAGDYSARVGLEPGREELGQLIGAFDEMAHSLESLSRQNRLILDSVDEGILGVDREGRIVFANPAAARALGRSVEELLGQDGHAVVHPTRPDGSPIPAAECRVLAAMRDGRVRHGVDEAFRRRDGSAFPAEFVASPLVDGGAIVGLVLAFRDVGERRRLEEQLRHSQKMEAVGQLAGGVAHDFNNLLTAIVSFARLVQEALPPGHESQPDVREILVAADRAGTLTRQLLAFSRRQRLAPRVVDLAGVVRGMEPMLRRILGETVALEVAVRAPGTVVADPGQLELAVLNLAVNARDAMPDGGRVVIEVDERAAPEPSADDGALLPGPVALLSVRDGGVGMDDATRARVFEPFFTTKPLGKGTGLGLSTVYGIVSQSGGAIRVRSAPGQGSEFRILLPLHAEEAAPERELRPGPAAGGPETILLVEDDPAIRAVARRALDGAGYRVVDAASAEAALTAADALQGPLHLLVSDVILPGRNGWDLARALEERRPGVRVLFVSGYARHASGVALVPADAPFLAKPFAPDDLLRAVRSALDAPERPAAAAGIS